MVYDESAVTTFIGVDLAWQGRTNHTGIAVAKGTQRGCVLQAVSNGVRSFEAAADFICEHATSNTVVAIDAPLVIRNETGRRECESLVSRKFGARHASAHSSNLSLYPRGGPAQLVRMLEDRGFSHDLELEKSRHRGGRWMFEVYPHPAQVVLFARDFIIRYKKGRVGEKRAGLATLRQYLSTLSEAQPPLESGDAGSALLSEELTSLRGAALKAYEDLLDAWFCSYLALYLWWWGGERNEMLGDLASGYIVVPTHALGRDSSRDEA